MKKAFWSSAWSRAAALAGKGKRWFTAHWKLIAVLVALLWGAGELRRWEMGRMHGPIIHVAPDGVSEWRSDGTLVSRAQTYRGMKHGLFEEWSPFGRTKTLGWFNTGQVVGPWHYFDSDGNLIHYEDFGR